MPRMIGRLAPEAKPVAAMPGTSCSESAMLAAARLQDLLAVDLGDDRRGLGAKWRSGDDDIVAAGLIGGCRTGRVRPGGGRPDRGSSWAVGSDSGMGQQRRGRGAQQEQISHEMKTPEPWRRTPSRESVEVRRGDGPALIRVCDLQAWSWCGGARLCQACERWRGPIVGEGLTTYQATTDRGRSNAGRLGTR